MVCTEERRGSGVAVYPVRRRGEELEIEVVRRGGRHSGIGP